MYYIINITDDADEDNMFINYTAETYMFPALCNVDDIVSGRLTLEDKCCQNLTKMYDIMFEKQEGQKITTVVDLCIKNIIDAHFTKPVIGIFNNGKYDEKMTLLAEDFSVFTFEPLIKEYKK